MDDMTSNFFQFNWIFIDTVIIILLILLLVSVKVLKEKFRWRYKVSNSALYQCKFDKESFKLKNQDQLIKRFTIIRNNVFKNKIILPTIIFIRITEKKRNLINILTEGLASYGFDVINLKLKKKPFQKHEGLNTENQKNIVNLLSDLLNLLNEHQLIFNSNYFAITFYNSFFLNQTIISNLNNTGIILINPIFNLQTQKKLTEIITNKDLINKISFIYSRKSKIFPFNKGLQNFLIKFPYYEKTNSNLTIIEGCKNSFKFYETILLGLIINIIESRF